MVKRNRICARTKNVLSKEAAHLNTRAVLQPKPASTPPAKPGAMRVGAEGAIACGRPKGEFALGTCLACRGARLNATYRKGGGGEREREKIWLRCHSEKQGIYTEENNAPPTWRGADGRARYDVPVALTDLTIAEKLIIARLSVTVAIHRLAHGGVSSTGHVATFPEPAEPMAAVLPRLPADVAIIRVRRGAAASSSKKQNRLYTVRRKKAMDALRWR